MLDAHVHLERGPYTTEWLTEFVTAAGQRGITELHLLDHTPDLWQNVDPDSVKLFGHTPTFPHPFS